MTNDDGERRLSRRQRELLAELRASGFIEKRSGFGRSQQNRPLWALVEHGFALFDFGPKGSFLKTYGFLPTPSENTDG